MKAVLTCIVAALAVSGSLAVGADEPTDEATADQVSGDQPADSTSAGVFRDLDANSDGQLVADEIAPEKSRLFERLLRTSDENDDGKLDLAEFEAGTASDRLDRPLDKPYDPRERMGKMLDGDPSELFRRADANGDGQLTLDEAPAERREFFERIVERADQNGDHALSVEEFSQGFAKMRQMMGRQGDGDQPEAAMDDRPGFGGDALFAALDANGDGTLGPDEIAGASAALAKLDRDGDGVLSRAEANPAGAQAGTAGDPTTALAGKGKNGRPQRPGAGKMDGSRMIERIMQSDANGDGKISKDEAPEKLQTRFDRLDANRDGFLDQAELKRSVERVSRGLEKAGKAAKARRPGKKPGAEQ